MPGSERDGWVHTGCISVKEWICLNVFTTVCAYVWEKKPKKPPWFDLCVRNYYIIYEGQRERRLTVEWEVKCKDGNLQVIFFFSIHAGFPLRPRLRLQKVKFFFSVPFFGLMGFLKGAKSDMFVWLTFEVDIEGYWMFDHLKKYKFAR